MSAAAMPVIQVVAAVIYKSVAATRFTPPWNEYLLAQRPPGKVYAGYWEFPGGKVEPGETHLDALKREIREELGVEVLHALPWLVRRHVYEHASVELHFFRVIEWRGTPRNLEGQQFVFQRPGQESVGPMLPANGPLLRAMALPAFHAITNAAELGMPAMLARLEAALAQGLRLVQVREPNMPADQFKSFAREVLARCRAAGTRVVINRDIALAEELGADGVQLPARVLLQLTSKPDFALVGASIHTTQELAHAERLDCDYALLGSVLPTRSHPDVAPLGWEGYVRIAGKATLPVFALGGLKPQDAATAWSHGAHGVAMLRAAWD